LTSGIAANSFQPKAYFNVELKNCFRRPQSLCYLAIYSLGNLWCR